eukprot:9667855-Alexandrium_andersonii.AAC.1
MPRTFARWSQHLLRGARLYEARPNPTLGRWAETGGEHRASGHCPGRRCVHRAEKERGIAWGRR